jgi:hypothetical protein
MLARYWPGLLILVAAAAGSTVATVALLGATQASPVPPLGDVAKVELGSVPRRVDANKLKPRMIVLTEKSAITEILDWLKKIDWSQKGTDLKVVRIPSPDASVVLVKKDGSREGFGIYWKGNIVHERANRLLTADTTALRKIFQRLNMLD